DAMKYIERGHKVSTFCSIYIGRSLVDAQKPYPFSLLSVLNYVIDENVAREIIIHRSLRHPNIIRFKEQICHLDRSPTPRLKICNFVISTTFDAKINYTILLQRSSQGENMMER
ncbi:protein kinase, partial [Striga asiatica]